MFFLNPWLLLGLTGISIPVLLHLLNRRKSRRIEWGAMLFLVQSLAQRRRKIMVEDMLLLATRCLIVALAVLAVARPYSSGDAAVAIAAIASAVLAVALMAAAAVIWSDRSTRTRLLIAASAFAAFALATASVEGVRTAMRRHRSGAKDVALIIDASSSMSLRDSEGRTAFERAIKEADAFIQSSPRNTAFAIILGATPSVPLSASPISDRKALFSMLDSARPLEGTLNAPDTIAAAAAVLGRGANGNKQIVIFGDGQRTGWDFGDRGQWARVDDILSRLPSTPRIVWRTLGLPQKLRNATVAELSLSREDIGTDRETTITATVANDGDEAVSPSSLMLSVEGKNYTESTIGQLAPGERRTVTFRHRFASPGTKTVKAILDATDDLPSDNSLVRVAAVRKEARVLIVEGVQGRRLSDSPGAFAALALSPTAAMLDGMRRPGKNRNPQDAKSDRATGVQARHFFAPKLISAADLPSIEDLSGYAAIILADIPRLSSNDEARVTSFVERGGGLMTISAKRADNAFYNSWTGSDGLPFMPLTLLGDEYEATDGIPLDAKSISHPALARLAENGDFPSLVVERRRRATPAEGNSAQIGASLMDGTPLLASRRAGRGGIVQFTAALDPSSGNLISRQSFLPAIHSLVGHLVTPISPSLNLKPSPSAAITLSSARIAETQGMLRAVVREGGADGPLLKVSAVEPGKQGFVWRADSDGKRLPSNTRIYARLTGSITVPASGKWKFWQNGTRGTLSFPGDHRYLGLRRSSLSVDLDEGKSHGIAIDVAFDNRGQNNFTLWWQGPGVQPSPVPSSAVSPVFPGEGTETFPATVESPMGPVEAFVAISGGTTSLRIPSRLASGIYTASVPAPFATDFDDIAALSNGFARITFCVAPDPAESVLLPATQEDAALVSSFVDLTIAATPHEFDKAMHGAKVGRELWRFAAFPLFFLIVAEIFLTRWISRRRRLGEDDRPDFEDRPQVSSRFAEMLAKMKGGLD